MIRIDRARDEYSGRRGSPRRAPDSARSLQPSSALLDRLEWAAYRLDEGFHIPGSRVRFGWDALAKIVPVFGDLFGLIASLILFRQFRRFGLPRVTLVRMGLNIGIDYFVGLVPILGPMFDVFWKPNVWNVGLLRRHLSAATPERARKARRNDYLFVILASILIAILLAASAVAFVWLLHVLFRLLPSLM
jgi:hypothetical protein